MNSKLIQKIGLVCATALFVFGVELKAETTLFPEKEAVAFFGQASPFLSASLAKDGAHFSLVRMNGAQPQLDIYSLEDNQQRLVHSIALDAALFTWQRWVDNKRLLASITRISPDAPALKTSMKKKKRRRKKDKTERAKTGLQREIYIINIETGTSKLLLTIPLNVQQANGSDSLLHILPDDPDHVMLAFAPNAGKFPGVYKLNLSSGDTMELEPPHKPFRSWNVDLDGNLQLAHGWGDDQLEVQIKTTAESEWESLNDNKLFANGRFGIIGFSDDGRNLYVRSSLGKGRSTIYRFDLKRKAIREKIFAHGEYDAGTLITTDGGKKIVAATFVDTKLRFKYFDKEFEDYHKTIAANFPDLDFYTLSFSAKGAKSLISVSSPQHPPELYLYTEGTSSFTPLVTRKIPTGLSFSEMKPVTYFSRDGVEIRAFLSLPPGYDSAYPGPAILMPHGGPWVRDSIGYDYWVQFLTSQGYAVLQPNYRGSTGYGDSFEIRGYGEWGKAMQRDLDDGAKWLIQQGYADGDRLCMVGGSYGGYAALAAATLKGFNYQCAVAYAPVSDLGMWINSASSSKAEKKSLRYRIFGSEKPKIGKKVSPAFLAKKANMPVLIAHGTSDIRVIPVHSRKMVQALKKAKKEHTALWMDGGSHFMMQTKHRTRFFKELGAFLKEHTSKDTG